MRLLHTSDWHLGRSFHGASLLEEQEAAIDRLVELTADAAVDLVVIAGDLFDRAIPPAPAVELFDDAVARLRDTGAAVVAIAGNHDSPGRVSLHDRLLARLGVTVRGDPRRLDDPLLLTPDDGGPPVAVYPVPYLEPAVAAGALDDLDGGGNGDGAIGDGTDPEGASADDDRDDDHQRRDERDRADDADADRATPARRRARRTHQEVTARACERIRAHAAATGPVRTVVVAHTFVAGGATSESERELSVGNVDQVDVAAFAGFDYVALGHLHGAQVFDGGRLAYSGTPLPYSFSEEAHTKSARIVEVAAEGTVRAEVVPLEVGRRLCTLEGTLDDLLADPDLAHATSARVRVVLTDDDLPTQAMARIQRRFPHAVLLRHEPPRRAADDAGGARRALRERPSPLDLALTYWHEVHGTGATDAHRDVLHAALAATSAAEVTDDGEGRP